MTRQKICQICHETNFEWTLSELAIKEIGRFWICDKCHKKIKDFVVIMLENKGKSNE